MCQFFSVGLSACITVLSVVTLTDHPPQDTLRKQVRTAEDAHVCAQSSTGPDYDSLSRFPYGTLFAQTNPGVYL